MQLTLDQYAAWVEQEQKWRLTPEELVLLKQSYDYTRSERKREMPADMKFVRNTKAREYRRVKTFEKYLSYLDEKREKSRAQNRQSRMNSYWGLNEPKQKRTEVEVAMSSRLYTIRQRVEERQLPFDLDLEFLVTIAEQLTECPCCHQPLSYEAAQLDKHVPSLGYVKTNVNFLCSTCNRLKSDHTVESLQRVLNYMMG